MRGVWRYFLGFLALFLALINGAFVVPSAIAEAMPLRADLGGQIMDDLPTDTHIDVYARSWTRDGAVWYYVGTEDGMAGWVPAESIGAETKSVIKVGLQVGHWRRQEASYPFSAASGASGGGLTEAEMNLITAKSVARHLLGTDVQVDILPTVIPKGYRADAVVAIHADGGPASRRGFFVDRPGGTSSTGPQAKLAQLIADEFRSAVSIPYVYRGTANSQHYYGYYDVASSTPMVLIETGFLSNDADRTILVNQSETTGAAIAEGILKFLNAGNRGQAFATLASALSRPAQPL